MIESKYSAAISKGLSLLFCVIWLFVVQYLTPIPTDVGDGIMHFYICQASWSEPLLFLEHWGKPFFILLSSPFAQFGFHAIVVFNILVFTATVLFAWKILKHFSIPFGLQCLFPFVLITIYEYSSTVVAGLTEPLFSLFVMIACWFLITKRWMWFAVIVSFLPFMRSEGQLAIVLAFLILLYFKQFKAIPLLVGTFIVYSWIGYYAYGDFWWYFTLSPYEMKNNVYGHGEWNHYLVNYRSYIARIGLFLFLIGTIRLSYLFYKKRWNEIEIPWLLFAYGIFFGILVSHSYFWATGTNGSCGLLRIGTQGMPSFLLINIYYLGKIRFDSKWMKSLKMVLMITILVLIAGRFMTSRFPKKPHPLDIQVQKAAQFLLHEKGKGHRFFFHHPLFVFEMGENPFLKNQECELYYCGGLKSELGTRIKPGDYIIRDSHFGPKEAQFPLSELKDVPEVLKIKEFISSDQVDDPPYNEVEGITVYQYLPKK